MASGSVLPVPSNPARRSRNFYVEQASTDPFVEIQFIEAGKTIVFTCRDMTIISDGANPVEFSFDGTNVHGEINIGEQLRFPNRAESSIWIRSSAASTPGTLRIYVW